MSQEALEVSPGAVPQCDRALGRSDAAGEGSKKARRRSARAGPRPGAARHVPQAPGTLAAAGREQLLWFAALLCMEGLTAGGTEVLHKPWASMPRHPAKLGWVLTSHRNWSWAGRLSSLSSFRILQQSKGCAAGCLPDVAGPVDCQARSQAAACVQCFEWRREDVRTLTVPQAEHSKIAAAVRLRLRARLPGFQHRCARGHASPEADRRPSRQFSTISLGQQN